MYYLRQYLTPHDVTMVVTPDLPGAPKSFPGGSYIPFPLPYETRDAAIASARCIAPHAKLAVVSHEGDRTYLIGAK